jgi:hypothetical protein
LDPLCIGTLVRLSAAEHVLIIAMEHLIGDAVSINIAVRDLFMLYRANIANDTPDLPMTGTTFATFADRQHRGHTQWRQLHGPFWQERLKGCSRLQFPADARSAGATLGWGAVPLKIRKELKAQLVAWARLHRTTLVMTILAVYAAVVLQWCKASSTVIRYQTDGRVVPEVANVMGYFAAILPLHVRLDPQVTWSQRVGQVIEEYCTACEHHDFCYLEAQVPPPDYVRNTCFNWIASGPRDRSWDLETALGTVHVEPFAFPNPLLFDREQDVEPAAVFSDSGDEVRGTLYFSNQRCSLAQMERFARAFNQALLALLHRPDRAVTAFSLQLHPVQTIAR